MQKEIDRAMAKVNAGAEGKTATRQEVVDMMIQGMQVLVYPNDGLRAVCEAVKEGEFDDNMRMMVEALSTVMLRHGGIGISAPQVGVPLRLIIVNLTRKNEDNIAILNPRIIERGEKMVTMREGCLSFPKVEVNVKRPAEVKIEAESFEGKTITLELKGLGARVVQHEMDHLDGKLLIDYVGGVKRDMIKRKMKKLHRQAKNQDKQPRPKTRKGRKNRSIKE